MDRRRKDSTLPRKQGRSAEKKGEFLIGGWGSGIRVCNYNSCETVYL